MAHEAKNFDTAPITSHYFPDMVVRELNLRAIHDREMRGSNLETQGRRLLRELPPCSQMDTGWLPLPRPPLELVITAKISVATLPLNVEHIALVRASQTSRRPFFKGDGFDLYVDRACGLPHSCTVSKVVVKVIGDVGSEVRSVQRGVV